MTDALNVVPADDDLVERLLTNALYLRKHEDGICRLEANCLDEAASRIASLSSELARCRNALDIPALAEKCAVACRSEQFPSTATYETRIARVLNAALNPIGEEGAREP
jgi:Mn-dependent DtxR family transcriptional regulator